MNSKPQTGQRALLAWCVFAAGAFVVSASATAGELQAYGGAHGVNVSLPAKASSMTVTGPAGFSVTTSDGYVESEAGNLPDGVYSYQVVEQQANPVTWLDLDRAARENEANGRSAKARPGKTRTVVVETGSFTIRKGVVITATNELEE